MWNAVQHLKSNTQTEGPNRKFNQWFAWKLDFENSEIHSAAGKVWIRWGMGRIWTNLQDQEKLLFWQNFHRFVQTKWTLIRYSKMDREGWFPKFVIMRNIIKSDMRKVTILLWSLSQDFSKIREITTISCLCQIYIQTILKFINNYACCPFKFYLSSKVQETTPSPRFMVYIHSRQKVQAKSRTLT